VTDVVSGQEKVLALPALARLTGYAVLAFRDEGLYVTKGGHEAPSLWPTVLWLLNPDTGAYRVLEARAPMSTIHGGSAWLPDLNPADPNPYRSSFSGDPVPNQILKRDLATGKTVTWLYVPGKDVSLAGFDSSDNPLVWVLNAELSAQTFELWVAPSPDSGKRLAAPAGVSRGAVVRADSQGTWFGTYQGLWLFTDQAGFHKLDSRWLGPAGPCTRPAA
jgi:hypothetical protein